MRNSYDDRAVRFTAEDGDGRAPGFAAGLAVPKEGDDSPGEGEAALSARAAGVLSLDGGTALYQQALTERMNPASTTKVMTAIVALKYGNLSDLVTVPEEAVITGIRLPPWPVWSLETRCPWKTCFTG